jgi:hypothetical protein
MSYGPRARRAPAEVGNMPTRDEMMDLFPEAFKVPMIVVGFKTMVMVQRPHQELTFNSIPAAREMCDAATAALATLLGDDGDGIVNLFEAEDSKNQIWLMGASRALYEDLGSILLLVAASTIDRFYRKIGVPLFDRGVASYVEGISFVRATVALANQYKHLGEWESNPRQNNPDRAIVEQLVDDPLRTDASCEFLKRMGFTRYEEFEDALLSCGDGIADPEIVAPGRGGLRRITIRPLEPGESA